MGRLHVMWKVGAACALLVVSGCGGDDSGDSNTHGTGGTAGGGSSGSGGASGSAGAEGARDGGRTDGDPPDARSERDASAGGSGGDDGIGGSSGGGAGSDGSGGGGSAGEGGLETSVVDGDGAVERDASIDVGIDTMCTGPAAIGVSSPTLHCQWPPSSGVVTPGELYPNHRQVLAAPIVAD